MVRRKYVCAAGCNRKLTNFTVCEECEGTYHYKCGNFEKFCDEQYCEILICSKCFAIDAVRGKYSMNTGSSSSVTSKKRKADDVIDLDAVDSENENQEKIPPLATVENPEDPTLAQLLKAMNADFQIIREEIKKSNSKQDANNLIINQTLKLQNENISKISSTVAVLKEENIKELVFSGCIKANTTDADLSAIAIDVAKFLGIEIKSKDIRRTRIIKKKENATQDTPNSFIVNFCSSSKCLRLLNQKKNVGKITNKDVFQYIDSKLQIFINTDLDKNTYNQLKKVKSWAKANEFKYAWISGGNILVRK